MKVKRSITKIERVIEKGIKYGLPLLIVYNLATQGGFLDSKRTKDAIKLHQEGNPVKRVVSVFNKYENGSPLEFTLSIMGVPLYNPKVTSEIKFNDNSKTTINYRTSAFQPFRSWIDGEEFNPHPKEKYEVTKDNELVRKITE